MKVMDNDMCNINDNDNNNEVMCVYNNIINVCNINENNNNNV